MIKLCSVSKSFGATRALESVDLEIGGGELVTLLGANGAGKSTLIRCLLGLTGYAGTIRVAGLDPLSDGPAVRARCGYLPQGGGLHHDLTVARTLELYAGLRWADLSRAYDLLEEFGLSDYRDHRVDELSGGLRQRLGFVVALLGLAGSRNFEGDDAEGAALGVLLLDEPLASLDPEQRERLAGRLRRLADAGTTIVVSTHDHPELAAVASRRITLEGGAVVGDCSLVAGGRAAPTGHERASENCEGAESSPRLSPMRPLLLKEGRDAVGNRWLIGYAAVLGLLGLVTAWLGLSSAGGLALQVFGRTTATLINLCLLLAPLVALSLGASAIAGERDRGTLETLLAQPLSRRRLLLAKYLGLLGPLTMATLAGFLPAMIMLFAISGSGSAVSLVRLLIFPMVTFLLLPPMLGAGLVISVRSRSAVQAQGTALFMWFFLVIFYDLMVLGALAFGRVQVEVLVALLAINPVDAVRVLSVLALEPDLYLLGPAGAFLVERFGGAGAAALLAGAALTWGALALLVATVSFRHPRSEGDARSGKLVLEDKHVQVAERPPLVLASRSGGKK